MEMILILIIELSAKDSISYIQIWDIYTLGFLLHAFTIWLQFYLWISLHLFWPCFWWPNFLNYLISKFVYAFCPCLFFLWPLKKLIEIWNKMFLWWNSYIFHKVVIISIYLATHYCIIRIIFKTLMTFENFYNLNL